MKRFKFPTIMILLTAAAVVIAAFATPAQALTYFFGAPGSICAATKTDATKLQVANNGPVFNKRTDAVLNVNCPLLVEQNTYAYIYVYYIKRDTQLMSCMFQRRSFDNLSGTVLTQNFVSNGTGFVGWTSVLTDAFNSVQCTLPKATGTATSQMSGVNGLAYATSLLP